MSISEVDFRNFVRFFDFFLKNRIFRKNKTFFSRKKVLFFTKNKLFQKIKIFTDPDLFREKMTNIIATFPITVTTQSSVVLNSGGVSTHESYHQTDLLLGDITWRSAEHKVSERYLLNDSQFFHNIRLEVFLVRREWHVGRREFDFSKEKLVYSPAETWTAKLRFRSV